MCHAASVSFVMILSAMTAAAATPGGMNSNPLLLVLTVCGVGFTLSIAADADCDHGLAEDRAAFAKAMNWKASTATPHKSFPWVRKEVAVSIQTDELAPESLSHPTHRWTKAQSRQFGLDGRTGVCSHTR